MAKQKTKQPVGYRLFPDNPRVISEDEFLRLQESLGDFGSLDGIVVNTSPGKYFKAIISGNQKAAIIGLENLVPKVSEQFETPTKSGTACYGFVEYMGEHFPYREVYWSEEKCEVGNIRANNYGGHNDPRLLAAFEEAVLLQAGIDLEYEAKAFKLLKGFEDVDPNELGTQFDMPSGDREPFQQMTFTFADEQAKEVKEAIKAAHGMGEYEAEEMFGNENGNGNAIYFIVKQWAEQRT